MKLARDDRRVKVPFWWQIFKSILSSSFELPIAAFVRKEYNVMLFNFW